MGGCAPYSGMPIWFSVCTSGMALLTSAPVARTADAMNSSGVFTFARTVCGDQNSGDWYIVRSTSRMSPSVFRKVCDMRSTSASGGLSLTNRMASFLLMKCAVEGWWARSSIISSPSFSPFS